MSMRCHSKDYFGAEGNRLAASVWGEGARTVLLLHGGGQTRHAWDKTGRVLADAGWRAVALDQRGHGRSAWVESGHYAFFDYAADADAVGRALKAAGAGPMVIVGASLGGIAGLYTYAAPAPVFDGLVLVDIVPQMDPNGVAHVQGFMRARAREGFASVEEAAEAVAIYLPQRPRPRSLEGLRKNLRHDPDGRWRWHWDPRFLDGPRSVNSDWPVVERVLEVATRNITAPLMLVRGGGSELVTLEAAAAFRTLAPHCDYADIAEARHMVAGDKNDAFSAAILGFLARHFAA